MANKGWLKILEELGWPPIFPISPKQFSMLEGEEKQEENQIDKKTLGLAATQYPVVTIHPGLKGKIRDNVIYHEVAHHLWPWRPHWWVECWAEKMAGGGGRGYYSKRFGHSPDDLPARNQLLKAAIRQSKRLRDRYRIKKSSE